MVALQQSQTSERHTGELIHALTGAEAVAEQLHWRIPTMDRAERLATFEAADMAGKLSWMVKAHILAVEIEESNYGDGAYLTLARVYGISARYVHELALVWNTFFADPEIGTRVPISLSEVSWYKDAAKAAHGDPSSALRFLGEAQDRKAANPAYSVTDFRLDLAAGMPQPSPVALVQQPEAPHPLTSPVGLPAVLEWIEQHPEASSAIEHKVSRATENHQLINASGSNEWYTPRPFLDAAHGLLGWIDLDPASNDVANTIVRARRYFTIKDNGLGQPWAGRLWLNPPYGIEEGESNQSRWSFRLITEYEAGNVTEALMLVNAVPGNHWFRPLKQFPICFPDSRIRFISPDGELGQPTHSNAIVYFGPQVARFAAIFARFGAVLATREVWEAS